MDETGGGGEEVGAANAAVRFRHAWRHRWRCAGDEVPCVLDGRVGSAHVAPGAISFVEHRRGPLGIKYVHRSTGWFRVAGLDRGPRGGEVRVGSRSYAWTFRHPEHARWAFDVVELPPDASMPERPSLHPSPQWLRD